MKTKLIILLAVVTIFFGLYGLVNSLSLSPPPLKEIMPNKVVKLKLWRLKKDVVSGEEIDQRTLALGLVSESKANELGFDENVSIDTKPGVVFRNALSEGSYISMNDVITPDQDGYINYVIAPERIPFPISVDPSSVIGGVISANSFVDILALASPQQSKYNSKNSLRQGVSITPIFNRVKVLQVKESVLENSRDSDQTQTVTLILELTREQAAKMIVAKKIADIEVYKSVGDYDPSELHADAGDILSDFNAITEYRANDVTIK
ncbi:Flp pilus assembly protein CpaB [Aliivibrio sp. S4TY2]|uniref:Flp pilus assembly protein CpaB n=1 Tax=unclassified Aliivibrio TaxID=2645654 RepID=UPI0023780358|nr:MULTISPECIES: Flp pilus assembly protein CpaB [unclassified Aliivibrio]MDD9158204.1 Flp pilus assembly protein CpaB [Aliivibrio sp. S4TY2]MDD9162119.1 Flp pilus assembly protein CpaB [Aliivibrio sp. S4TY1]MDD9166157.1 Flp pilus assembly protein CpaB [Aliivibrio sp. S4MY2]MDD9170155.1 Flp pilus assembly protein CpaB [Aliivibrio sp. S4MY4]MDD9187200.1 Flp pilus assembly protein CpaB [Aliivibrio sp. S4MY3]